MHRQIGRSRRHEVKTHGFTGFKRSHIFHGIGVIVTHTVPLARQTHACYEVRPVLMGANHFDDTRIFTADGIKVEVYRTVSGCRDLNRIVDAVITYIFGQTIVENVRPL